MDLAHMPTAPMRWWVLRSTNTGCNHTGSLRGFKTTASSCGNSHGPYYTLHSVTAALPASSRNLDDIIGTSFCPKAAPSHIVDRPIHRQLIIKSNTPCGFPYRDSSLVPHSQHAGTCTRHNFGDVREQHPHASYTNSNNIPLRESLHRRAPLCRRRSSTIPPHNSRNTLQLPR